MSSSLAISSSSLPKWVEPLRLANCSALVRIKNKTGNTLIRTDFLLPSGMWREFPAEIIEPDKETLFGTESLGFPTGTEGTVIYHIGQGQEPFVFHWSVPFAPWYSCEADCTYSSAFRIGKEILSQGKAFTVEFSVYDPFEGDYRHNSKDAQIITVAPIIIESWKVQLKNAGRSVLATVNNSSQHVLHLKNVIVSNGILRCNPPKIIEPNTTVDFGVESNGIFGCDGYIIYEVILKEGNSDVHFFWDIPLIGPPTFQSNCLSIEKLASSTTYHHEIALHFSSDEVFALLSSPRKHDLAESTAYGFET